MAPANNFKLLNEAANRLGLLAPRREAVLEDPLIQTLVASDDGARLRVASRDISGAHRPHNEMSDGTKWLLNKTWSGKKESRVERP